MSLSGRLLTVLMILPIGSCENFTLIGSVNLGGGGGLAIDEPGAADVPESGVEPGHDLCWPSAKGAIAEMRDHGYDHLKPEWAETAKWFAALEPIMDSLPACE